LRLRYDQHQDRQKDRQAAQLENVNSILRPGRFRRDPRQLDEEEEMWFNDDEYEDDNGPNTNSTNSPSGQTTSPGNAIVSQSTSISPSGVSQSQANLASSGSSPTASGIPNVSSPTGGSPILAGSNNVGITSAVSLAAAAAVAACGATATSPLAAAAAVAASAGATVGFSAVVDGVVAANSDTNNLIHQNVEGQTILPTNEKDDGNKPTLTNVKKALVDYDSDEDEDEDEDEDDEEEVCEDEDAIEEDEDNISEVPHGGSLSSASIGSTMDNTKPKEDKIVTDKITVDATFKNDKVVHNEATLSPPTNISSDQPLTNSEKVAMVKNNEENEHGSLKEEHTSLSGTTADTQDSPQSSTKDCNYSIVQNNADGHSEKEEPTKENAHNSNKVEAKNGNITSPERNSIHEDSGNIIGQVSSDGDGKGVSSLIRSNECLENLDDGPAKKRQRLCSLEDQEGAEGMNDKKELSVTSEVKLQ